MNPITTLRNGYRWLVDPYRFLDEAQARHGLTFRIRLPVLGDALMTGDPRLIAEIVHHRDLEGGRTVSALRAILGQRSLIMLDGEEHAARHRLIAPLFQGEALHAHDELTIRLTREVLNEIPIGQTFSLYPVVQRIGLDVMIAAMFGQDSPVAAEARDRVARFLGSFRNPLILFLPLLRVNAGPWRRALRNRQALCDLIRQQIRNSALHPSALLARLVATALPEEDLIEEVLSLLLFGHDTAAATMAWAFAHIYSDRVLVERLRDEPEHSDLLGACIKESMRLSPVVVHLSRTATTDLRLGSYEVRRDSKVIPCTYLAQHNPEVFPEPHKFRPERFLNGKRYEHSYFPFGFGRRTCVGKPFALHQMPMVIGTALRSLALELAPGYRPAPRRHLVLILPRGGTLLRRSVISSIASKGVKPLAPPLPFVGEGVGG